MQDHAKVNAIPSTEIVSLSFLCLARDCEATVPLFFSYLDRLRQSGFQCRALIGENGSRDQTRALIQKGAASGVELLDTTKMSEGKRRLIRMAIGREALLLAARERGLLDADYVCVMDLDNVMTNPPSPEGLTRAIVRLREDKSLFAVGTSSVPYYYDILTLRAEGHDYTHMEAELAEAKKKPLTYYRYHQKQIYTNQRRMTKNEPIYCTSSFNGFCIYNSQDFSLGSYFADNVGDVCEHVSLNLSIGRTTGKRMVIGPELVIRTPADHAPVGFFRFWLDRIKKKTA